MDEIWSLGIAGLGRAIAARELSPVAVVETSLARISALDPALKFFVTVMADEARAAAAEAEREIAAGRYRGPLHGVPIGVKDIVDVAGVATTNGSHLTLDAVAKADSVVVEKLRAAGAVIVGKTETHEFAIGGPDTALPNGPARNPWNPEHYPGGSSSGSGSAVGARAVPGAIGTDTGGSIRTPSAYCGLAGMKPTYGRVSRRGVTPLSYSLDHIGPMTWTVEDNALMLEAIAGHDPLDPASADVTALPWSASVHAGVKGLRVGLVRNFHAEEPAGFSAEIGAAFENAGRALAEAGAQVSEVRLSPVRDYIACQRVIMYAEAAAVHERDMQERLRLYGPYSIERMLPGFLFSATDYVQAMRRRTELVAELRDAMRDVDVLLVAGAVSAAPRIDAVPAANLLTGGTLSANAPFNVTGNPGLIVCAGFNPTGLPLSVQIVGKPFDEASAYRAGHVVESVLGERHRSPGIATLREAA